MPRLLRRTDGAQARSRAGGVDIARGRAADADAADQRLAHADRQTARLNDHARIHVAQAGILGGRGDEASQTSRIAAHGGRGEGLAGRAGTGMRTFWMASMKSVSSTGFDRKSMAPLQKARRQASISPGPDMLMAVQSTLISASFSYSFWPETTDMRMSRIMQSG